MKLAQRMSRIKTESAYEVLAKARALEKLGKNIIHLEIGEPDFPTPSHVVAAGKRALDEGWSGRRPFHETMADYQAARDEHVLPMYEFTAELASLEPPPPELRQLLEAAQGNQEAMDAFARVNAGVTSPSEFFSEENVRHIFAATR